MSLDSENILERFETLSCAPIRKVYDFLIVSDIDGIVSAFRLINTYHWDLVGMTPFRDAILVYYRRPENG